jgi:error-prone DNA polymerase
MNALYSELHCLSNFSFQRGASHPQELVRRAQALGYRALAITDECSLAGIVRAWEAAKELEFHLIVGAEFEIERGPKLVLLAPDVAAYSQLCALISHARRRSAKGRYHLGLQDLERDTDGLLALWLPQWEPQRLREAVFADEVESLRERFASRLWLGWERHLHPQDRERLELLQRLGRRYALPLLAAGDVHYHARARQALQDVMACIRAGTSLRDAAPPLFSNTERHLRPLAALQRLYPPELLRETLVVTERCSFDFSQLRYDYPHELVPDGLSATQHLRDLVEAGIRWRWPGGCSRGVRADIEKELGLIAELRYAKLFPDGARDNAVRTLARHPVPGARLGGEFGGVLRAGHHRDRSGAGEPAVRTLHFEGARRAAGYRHRLRASAARGGDPAYLYQVWTGARGHRRHRHQLPPAQRDARCGQGAGAVAGAGGCLVEELRALG